MRLTACRWPVTTRQHQASLLNSPAGHLIIYQAASSQGIPATMWSSLPGHVGFVRERLPTHSEVLPSGPRTYLVINHTLMGVVSQHAV
jgi:hypothetical protein